jgi:succinoglycan biosynthesis protein ExoO
MSALSPTPKVTVAIPVYNSASTLPRCLRSVMAQSVRDIEILVADDGSTDASAAVAAEFATQDQRIRVLRMPRNRGKSRAMNRMTEEARGEWFAVLDADDAYLPERLERLLGASEAAAVEMVADNITYFDAGIGSAVRTAFDPAMPLRFVTKHDLAANSNSFATFDFGILKPMMRRAFLLRHGLRYHEDACLSEDFYYLMNFFVAGGRGHIISEPLYQWTMPFGTISRRWTETGNGAWRYDYRNALRANRHFIEDMTRRGESEMVTMLRARERQYVSMIHYIDAQRAAADRRFVAAALNIGLHPSTYRVLATRVTGRFMRTLRRVAGRPARLAAQGVVQ